MSFTKQDLEYLEKIRKVNEAEPETFVKDAAMRLADSEIVTKPSRTKEKKARLTNRNKITQQLHDWDIIRNEKGEEVQRVYKGIKKIHHEKKSYYSHANFWNTVHGFKSGKPKEDAKESKEATPTVVEMTGKKASILSGFKSVAKRLFNRKAS